MGDLIMSTPAMRALKETFGAKITMLTSKMGSMITPFIPEIDEVMVANLPWVKSDEPVNRTVYADLVNKIADGNYDLAVIFTVFSQNPLPAAMLAFQAGIPETLAYCRENPYHLISQWVPETEPYEKIQHQVRRDLNLVAAIGASVQDDKLGLKYGAVSQKQLKQKLQAKEIDKPYVLLHPGVSEIKREYPIDGWKSIASRLKENYNVLITGSRSERALAEEIAAASGTISFAGELGVDEWLALIDDAACVVSVNTGTIHIAAAFQTPVLVLYALTNPQHTPWKTPAVVLPFSVREDLRSRNQVVCHLNKLMAKDIPIPEPDEVCKAVGKLLDGQYDMANEGLLLHLQER